MRFDDGVKFQSVKCNCTTIMYLFIYLYGFRFFSSARACRVIELKNEICHVHEQGTLLYVTALHAQNGLFPTATNSP